MWSFSLYVGLLEVVADGETRLGVVLDSIESMAGILSTMTIIVVLVVQYHFRKAKTEVEEAQKLYTTFFYYFYGL